MKQYKHIPTGEIVTFGDGGASMQEYIGPLRVGALLEGKDWEEVKAKPKEWEITAFRDKSNRQIMNLPMARTVDGFINSESYSVKTGDLEIYSVKRFSDGVEFKIGDSISLRAGGEIRKLATIGIEFNQLRLRTITGFIHLEKAVKHEKVFTTEDGVDIYQGDVFWYLPINSEWQPLRFDTKVYNSHIQKWRFSTKEAAEEYILMNKPCLSLNDVFNTVPSLENSRKTLKELVKSKIKK